MQSDRASRIIDYLNDKVGDKSLGCVTMVYPTQHNYIISSQCDSIYIEYKLPLDSAEPFHHTGIHTRNLALVFAVAKILSDLGIDTFCNIGGSTPHDGSNHTSCYPQGALIEQNFQKLVQWNAVRSQVN